MKKSRYKQALIVVIHTAIITLMAVLFSNTIVYRFTSMLAFKSSVEVKDYQISDLYTVVSNESLPSKVSDNVVLIPVDGMSGEEIATVVNFAKGSNPKAIGIDLLFYNSHSGDEVLIEALSDSTIIVASDPSLTAPYFRIIAAGMKNGIAVIDTIKPFEMHRKYIRAYNTQDTLYNTFATELVRTAGYHVMEKQSTYIYYPTLYFPHITPEMIVEYPDECRNMMAGKIVLIGDINSPQDEHPTPLGMMSGLRIQACIIETIIGNHNIERSSSFFNWIIAIISCIILILFNIFLSKKNFATGKLLLRLAQILALYIFFQIGCWFFAEYDWCIDFAPALSMIAVGLLSYDVYFGILALYNKSITKKRKK